MPSQAETFAAPEITAQLIEERWLKSLALFELWTDLWAQSPEIAQRSGSRVEELMLPLEVVQQRYLSRW